jgi:hypothetical protein
LSITFFFLVPSPPLSLLLNRPPEDDASTVFDAAATVYDDATTIYGDASERLGNLSICSVMATEADEEGKKVAARKMLEKKLADMKGKGWRHSN